MGTNYSFESNPSNNPQSTNEPNPQTTPTDVNESPTPPKDTITNTTPISNLIDTKYLQPWHHPTQATSLPLTNDINEKLKAFDCNTQTSAGNWSKEHNNDNNKSSLINSLINETYSPPVKKSIICQQNQVEEDNENESSSINKDINININIKSVFSGLRPWHEDYPMSYQDIQTQDSLSYLNSASSGRNDYELNFYRNGEEIRRSYIAKLICKKVWIPSEKEKTHNSWIIFDWDDTLWCTSFWTPNGVFNEDMVLDDKDKEKVVKLEFCVWRWLTLAIEKGDVYIVTNAGQGWVEYSAEKFYPSWKTVLGKIQIISARGLYESKYPGDSRKWKIQTFLNLKNSMNVDLVTNIICLGDSFIEMEAGHIWASKFQQAYIKTVKFRESPKPEEWTKQLTLVADQFAGIYTAIKNLTVRVEKKRK